MKKTIYLIILALIITVTFFIFNKIRENQILRKIIERLSADSRVAEVLVSNLKVDPKTQNTYTTIKFVEYDTTLRPLPAKYFSFQGNILQFQALVVRFDDFYIKQADPLKGKSAYIFLKAFALNGEKAQVFQINSPEEIPSGYKIQGTKSAYEEKLWRKFWEYALNPEKSKKAGIKNAQIEAPGTKFVPGLLYTIKIEHDGGLRIDTQKIPEILKGENIKF